jgi:hypothetical protein
MAKQVIFCDARVQLLKEFRGIHEAPWEFSLGLPNIRAEREIGK